MKLCDDILKLEPANSESCIVSICTQLNSMMTSKEDIHQEEVEALLHLITNHRDIHHEQWPRILFFVCGVVATKVESIEIDRVDVSTVIQSLISFLSYPDIFYYAVSALEEFIGVLPKSSTKSMTSFMETFQPIWEDSEGYIFCHLHRVVGTLFYKALDTAEMFAFLLPSPSTFVEKTMRVLRTTVAEDQKNLFEEESNIYPFLYVVMTVLGVQERQKEMQDLFLQKGLLPVLADVLQLCYREKNHICYHLCCQILSLLMCRYEEDGFAMRYFRSEPKHPLRPMLRHYQEMSDECRESILYCIEVFLRRDERQRQSPSSTLFDDLEWIESQFPELREILLQNVREEVNPKIREVCFDILSNFYPDHHPECIPDIMALAEDHVTESIVFMRKMLIIQYRFPSISSSSAMQRKYLVLSRLFETMDPLAIDENQLCIINYLLLCTLLAIRDREMEELQSILNKYIVLVRALLDFWIQYYSKHDPTSIEFVSGIAFEEWRSAYIVLV